MVIGIIGAGASGMAAALAASQDEKVQVVLLERQTRAGRKLLATGNGRCNLTNRYAAVDRYHGEDPTFAQYALSAMDADAVVRWFGTLGLFTVTEPSGKVYPYSDQANSVVDVLRFALDRPNVQLHTGFEVQKVRLTGGGFLVSSGKEEILCDRLIVACGGLAGTKLGGSMSGYKLLSKFGHKTTKLRPALVQLKCDWKGVAALKGVRTNCHVQILQDGTVFAESQGELQFTDYGLSGPVIFEVSRDACFGNGAWCANLDFLPSYSTEDIFRELCRRRATHLPLEELLTGILHNRLGRVLTKAAGIRDRSFIHELNDDDLLAVCRCVKNFEIVLTEPMGMDNAQVTAGGILTGDFAPETMESRIVPGLYACGEVLDIDGDCGGFNLQWAWSSGWLAGTSAGRSSE